METPIQKHSDSIETHDCHCDHVVLLAYETFLPRIQSCYEGACGKLWCVRIQSDNSKTRFLTSASSQLLESRNGHGEMSSPSRNQVYLSHFLKKTLCEQGGLQLQCGSFNFIHFDKWDGLWTWHVKSHHALRILAWYLLCEGKESLR
jgi:hypothetical protein